MLIFFAHVKYIGSCVCCSVPAASGRIWCFLSWLPAWGHVCVLLFLHRWSALVGWLSVLECTFWGFLPLFALLHLFPLFHLFVTSISAAFFLFVANPKNKLVCGRKLPLVVSSARGSWLHSNTTVPFIVWHCFGEAQEQQLDVWNFVHDCKSKHWKPFCWPLPLSQSTLPLRNLCARCRTGCHDTLYNVRTLHTPPSPKSIFTLSKPVHSKCVCFKHTILKRSWKPLAQYGWRHVGTPASCTRIAYLFISMLCLQAGIIEKAQVRECS